MDSSWKNATQIEPAKFTCGWCDSKVASAIGYTNLFEPRSIYICPNCEYPVFLVKKDIFPNVAPGEIVNLLPPDVEVIYSEARRCAAANCFTAVSILCRKILMHIAVEKGADENKSFAYYVDYLFKNRHIPENHRGWVDNIREKGNDAVHEIKLFGNADGLLMIQFTEFLLKMVYEFPGKIESSRNDNV